ncbi:hypothetical protein POM88_008111 [Heracleum sosnowskyi]|uniref:Uncharacterized protein n=1 Tax=Heracleum sosnowskyi TaxID=360622 RepID=A0AAD8J819_9APIA|nr:hypothetical protein POM88_008111 [Heracleum sosnowskyi]
MVIKIYNLPNIGCTSLEFVKSSPCRGVEFDSADGTFDYVIVQVVSIEVNYISKTCKSQTEEWHSRDVYSKAFGKDKYQELTSLTHYATRMKVCCHNDTFYLREGNEAVANLHEAVANLHIEKLKKRLMVYSIVELCDEHRVREYVVNGLVNDTKEEWNVDDENEEEKHTNEFKKKSVGDMCIKKFFCKKYDKVVVDDKVLNLPCYLVTSEWDCVVVKQVIRKAQAFRDNNIWTLLKLHEEAEVVSVSLPIITEMK